MHLQKLKGMQSSKQDMGKGVPFVNRMYTKGVRGWTSGRSLPFMYKQLLSTPPTPTGGMIPETRVYPRHCDLATFQTGPLEPRPRWRKNITLRRPLAHYLQYLSCLVQ